MKKTICKIICLLLAGMSLLTLCACGRESASKWAVRGTKNSTASVTTERERIVCCIEKAPSDNTSACYWLA